MFVIHCAGFKKEKEERWPNTPALVFNMKYLLALLLPPLAVLLCGKFGQFILNCILCCFLWVPGVLHALFVVADSRAEARTDRIVKALRR